MGTPRLTNIKEKIILGIDTIIGGGVIFGKWIRDPRKLIVVGIIALLGITHELVKSPLQTEFISSGAKRSRGKKLTLGTSIVLKSPVVN